MMTTIPLPVTLFIYAFHKHIAVRRPFDAPTAVSPTTPGAAAQFVDEPVTNDPCGVC
jgi:hypothetical protein